MYQSEIHRCCRAIELREQIEIEYDLTTDDETIAYSVTGKLGGVLEPDQEVLRARAHPPLNPIETPLQMFTGSDEPFGKGFPGTELVVGVTQIPPSAHHDNHRDDDRRSSQDVSVDGITKNGTVTLDGDWDLELARKSLLDNKNRTIYYTYDMEEFPIERIPVLIRTNLHGDAQHYLRNLAATGTDQDSRDSSKLPLKDSTDQAALEIEIEYLGDDAELNIISGSGTLHLDRVRLEMDTSASNISFWPPIESTRHPDQHYVEWRNHDTDGGVLKFMIVGPEEALVDLGALSATIQGSIDGATLTGTEIVGVYDRTGDRLDTFSRRHSQIDISHAIPLTAVIEIELSTDLSNVDQTSTRRQKS